MTTTPRFLQIHFLTPYSASLLNRDEAGFAKRMPFGGAVRTRISSQCQKRHWRTFDGPQSLQELEGGEAMSVRSRYIFERIAAPLREAFDPEQVDALVEAVANATLGSSEQSQLERDPDGLRTNQVIVLGHPEIDHLRRTVQQLLEDGAKADKTGIQRKLGREGLNNLEAMGRGAGLDAALFGRMKTADVLADCDAAVHVAHAFTVHAQHAEIDYFTAVDDLAREFAPSEGGGSGHLNEAELTSGLFYGYVAVDVPLLISNLEGVDPERWTEADRELAGEVTKRLLHLVASVSPGAKRGATAPYSRADFVAVEAGEAQPCTWANAFFEPVPESGNLREAALERLDEHLRRLDRMHAPAVTRRYTTMIGRGLGEERARDVESMQSLAHWARSAITEGVA